MKDVTPLIIMHIFFNNTGAEEGGTTGGNIQAFRGRDQGSNNYNKRTKCQNCGNFHRKDACRAKDKKNVIFIRK